tara:strand:+ start:185 stop:457 length:273 start_codon:yes stop_codon:yes gene_type:complete
MARPQVDYTFKGVQSVNLSNYGVTLTLADGDKIETQVDSKCFEPLLVQSIEYYLKWTASDETLKKLGDLIIKKLEAKAADDLAKSRGEDA